MEHVSLHGLGFVGLQLAIVLVLHWGLHRWHTGPGRERTHGVAGGDTRRKKRSLHGIPLLAGLGFVSWYLFLRTRPIERGADAFAYTLGVFDGVTLAGLASLVLLHLLLTRGFAPPPEKETPEEDEEEGGPGAAKQ